MAQESAIQWTESTWNPFQGCHKVSQGCKYCYASRISERWGKDFSVVTRSRSTFFAPLKWKTGKMIFTCSMSDFFIEEADIWRDELWKIIRETPQHAYQILTKRPERIAQSLPSDWSEGYENVWLGVSVENNDARERCEVLSEIPVKVRFISAEPLLEDVDFSDIFATKKFHWCIVGGESGNRSGAHRFRECKVDWIKRIIGDCGASEVKIFVKQLGTHLSDELNLRSPHGGDMSEWEPEIQIREFPFWPLQKSVPESVKLF